MPLKYGGAIPTVEEGSTRRRRVRCVMILDQEVCHLFQGPPCLCRLRKSALAFMA